MFQVGSVGLTQLTLQFKVKDPTTLNYSPMFYLLKTQFWSPSKAFLRQNWRGHDSLQTSLVCSESLAKHLLTGKYLKWWWNLQPDPFVKVLSRPYNLRVSTGCNSLMVAHNESVSSWMFHFKSIVLHFVPRGQRFEEARASLLHSFTSRYSEYTIPCFVSDGDPPEEDRQAQPTWR